MNLTLLYTAKGARLPGAVDERDQYVDRKLAYGVPAHRFDEHPGVVIALFVLKSMRWKVVATEAKLAHAV